MSEQQSSLPEVLVKQNQEGALISLYGQANLLELEANATTDPNAISAYEATIDIILRRYFLRHERVAAPKMNDCQDKVAAAVMEQYNRMIARQKQGQSQAHLVSERDNVIRLRAVEMRHDYITSVLEKRGQLVPFATESEREL